MFLHLSRFNNKMLLISQLTGRLRLEKQSNKRLLQKAVLITVPSVS